MTNNNSTGIVMDGSLNGTTLNVTIVDSEAFANGGAGVWATSPSGNAATVMLHNTVVSNNGIGLEADKNAVFRVAQSVVTGNRTGVTTSSGGVINSYGDNDIDGNSTNNWALLTPLATH